MKKFFALVLALTMVFCLFAGNASAATPETIKVRINCTNGANTSAGRGYALLGEKLEELSGGVFSCQVYYDGTYCSGTEALTEMAKGDLEIGGSGATYVVEYLPQYGFLQMAYLYSSVDHADKVLNGEIGAKIFQEVADTVAVLPLSGFLAGNRNVMLVADKKVETPADLSGVKMRTNGTESMMDMMSAMGANPVGVALGETYSALQTGVVDGQENPVVSSMDRHFHEVCKSLTYTEHYIDFTWFACSYNWYNSLTPELQQVVREAAVIAAQSITDEVMAQEAEAEGKLVEAGLSVYHIDKEPFMKAAEEYYSKYYDSWDMDTLNAIMALK